MFYKFYNLCKFQNGALLVTIVNVEFESIFVGENWGEVGRGIDI